MLTENQIEALGDAIAPLYQQLENDIISDIARRVKKTGRYTETAELMAQAMVEKGESPDKIRAEVMRVLRADKDYQNYVAKNTMEYKKQAVRDIRATEREAKKLGDEIIAKAGEMSYNGDLSMWEQAGQQLTKNSAFTKLVDEMAVATAGTLKNITRTTGFKGTHGMVAVKNAYTNYLDKAVLKVATGTFSFDQAVNDCVRELAQSGLRSIDYASGKSFQLDTAARMCVRTSAHQLSAKVSMQHCDDMGTDLVEVDSHWGARPEHASWQGKVYSRSGKNKKYPNFSVCRYGAVDGLCGINCRHTFYPFFDGISEPVEWDKEPEAKDYKGKKYDYYSATQKQRQMERGIRATKREIEAQYAIGGDSSALISKLKAQTNEYHGFSKAMEIRAKDNRLRVIAGSSSIKTTDSYRNAIKSLKTGASGAYTNINDPLGKKREKHAINYYNEIRNRNKSSVISKISKNANVSEKVAENVYNHVFIQEHKFMDGSIKKFDPDYNMSESFRRILEGKNIKPHDMIMIKHENLELNLMKKYNMIYEDAHKLSVEKYDYESALREFLRKAGD